MSIFPFVNNFAEVDLNNQEVDNDTQDVFKEFKWNFKENKLQIIDGKLQIIEGKPAIQTWIYKVLLAERHRYFIYSSDFGHDLFNLLQENYSNELLKEETKRYLEECLLINIYINAITNVKVEQEADVLKIGFKAHTEYGEVDILVEQQF